MSLEEKLKRLKKIDSENSEADWQAYKEQWINSVKELESIIMDKWFGEYVENKLMEFSIVPIKRIEPYIGQYIITSLEITLSNNKTLLLEPIAGITTEYSGKLEFSMLGNVYKRVDILRKNIDNKNFEWLIAPSYDANEHYPLTKQDFENLIEKWLS